MAILSKLVVSLLSLTAAFQVVGASPSHLRSKRCVVPSKYTSSGGKADDSPAVTEAFARCAADSTIIFSEGVDYNIFTPISATNLSNVEIQVQGNLHLPQNITAIQALVNATASQSLTWFNFAGSHIDYVGSSNVTTGWINSYGQAWWDANPVNGTGTASRPHLFNLDVTHGSMKYFKSRKPIAWGVALSGDDIVVTDTFVDAYSTGGFPFNTDGFDVSGSNIRISDTVIYNGDDAIAVQSGSSNIIFERATIGYQSHGMSIGSLGSNQASYASVSNITFDDVTVVNAVYAARFKSWMGGQGLAKNISWKNIRVYNVTFPIFVTQSYYDQGTGTGADRPNNSSVMMENFTWANFTGIINTFRPGDGSCVSDPCWYDVGLPNLNHTEAIIIGCNTNSSCKNFVTENIQVVPESAAPPTTICINATAALNPGLGFDCRNGTYIPF